MRFNMTTVMLILWLLSVIGLIVGIRKHKKWLWIVSLAVFCLNTAGTVWAWFDLYG